MEACGSAHFWGRTAQQIGHTVSLLPARCVRPYVRRNKTDRADADAILEAVRSGQLPVVAVKRVEQQAVVGLHRVREQWMTTRTARINVLRGLLREHGLLRPAGPRTALVAVPTLLADPDTSLPAHLRHALRPSVAPTPRQADKSTGGEKPLQTSGPRCANVHHGQEAMLTPTGRI
jgi:transposase